jgi:hypothetical protein
MWFKWLLVALFTIGIVGNAVNPKNTLSERILLPIFDAFLLLGVLRYWP